MGFWIFGTLAVSLLLTLILELLFAFVLGLRDRKDIELVCLVNVLTNPFVVLTHFLVLYYTTWNGMVITGFLEAGAVLVEGIYYKQYSRKIKHPLAFSLGANVFSYFAGEIINRLV